MARLEPGVFVEESGGGPRPIEGAPTSPAGFVGTAERGPLDAAVRVGSLGEFTQHYGALRGDAPLGLAVRAFFENGGRAAYVVRVAGRAEDGGAAAPGDDDWERGLATLDDASDVGVVAIPGVGTPGVISAALAHCAERRDRFFLADPGRTDGAVDEVRALVTALRARSSHGALYWPWLAAADPAAPAEVVPAPPSGFVAGLFARVDTARGVWKSPAGLEAALTGALRLESDATDAEQDLLAALGVNVIRRAPGAGLVAWGARTLATAAEPEFRYVAVRRTAIFLERSFARGLAWTAFEPNGALLWDRLRQAVEAFMHARFRAGAFAGRTAAEAFFVRCDATTTTPLDVAAGITNLLVGFAPLRPAEFVVLRISQRTADAA